MHNDREEGKKQNGKAFPDFRREKDPEKLSKYVLDAVDGALGNPVDGGGGILDVLDGGGCCAAVGVGSAKSEASTELLLGKVSKL